MKVKIVRTGQLIDVERDGDTFQRIELGEYAVINKGDVIRALQSLQTNTPLHLGIDPERAEAIWFYCLSVEEREDYNFIVEPTGYGCEVTIMLWDDFLTRGAISWRVYATTGLLIAVLSTILWGVTS